MADPSRWSELLPDEASRTFNTWILLGLIGTFLNAIGVAWLHMMGLFTAWILVFCIAFVVIEYG